MIESTWDVEVVDLITQRELTVPVLTDDPVEALMTVRGTMPLHRIVGMSLREEPGE